MKNSAAKEKLDLTDRELSSLAERINDLNRTEKAVKDIQTELKGLKLFLSRVHPDFKRQFPAIIKKLKS